MFFQILAHYFENDFNQKYGRKAHRPMTRIIVGLIFLCIHLCLTVLTFKQFFGEKKVQKHFERGKQLSKLFFVGQLVFLALLLLDYFHLSTNLDELIIICAGWVSVSKVLKMFVGILIERNTLICSAFCAVMFCYTILVNFKTFWILLIETNENVTEDEWQNCIEFMVTYWIVGFHNTVLMYAVLKFKNGFLNFQKVHEIALSFYSIEMACGYIPNVIGLFMILGCSHYFSLCMGFLASLFLCYFFTSQVIYHRFLNVEKHYISFSDKKRIFKLE